jgi:cell division GTPase FtsZ
VCCSFEAAAAAAVAAAWLCSSQVNEAAEIIYDLVDPDANLIFGAVIDESLQDDVSITLIATGVFACCSRGASPSSCCFVPVQLLGFRYMSIIYQLTAI